MTTDGDIKLTVIEAVHHIEVDRRANRNALTPEMLEALARALTHFDDDSSARVAVLSFAGDHASAGLDLARFGMSFALGNTGLDPTLVDPFGLERRCTKPLIAAVQGAVYTAGIEIMLAADIVIAADSSRFAQAEVTRGLAPFGGATFRYVERAGWGNAMYLLLRGTEFDADTAHRLGLVQEVVPHGEQVERALALAAEIAAVAPLGARLVKQQAETWLREGEQAAIAMTSEMMRTLAGSDDAREGLAAFVEKRPTRFSGR